MMNHFRVSSSGNGTVQQIASLQQAGNAATFVAAQAQLATTSKAGNQKPTPQVLARSAFDLFITTTPIRNDTSLLMLVFPEDCTALVRRAAP